MSHRPWRVTLTSLVILALALSLASAQADPCATIRVGLVRSFSNVRQVTVLASSDDSIVRTGSSDKLASYTDLEPVTIQIANSQLSLVPTRGTCISVGASVTIAPVDPAAVITIDSPGRPSKQYKGTIEVSIRSGTLRLVNTIGIEDYLPGVVTSEMPSSYPDEALKAQAVAARCYTLCSRGKHGSAGSDLCDDVHCQVYDGCTRERASCIQAVLATKGQVLAYKGGIARVMYCADCGGATQCYSELYPTGDFPYLGGVVEPSDIVHHTWEKSYTLADLSAKLVAGGIKEAQGLQGLAITKISSSGRGLAVEVTGKQGSTTISGAKLRSILGQNTIKSGMFTIDCTTDGVIVFRGKGLGHGIGMCQVGAAALASPPYNYTCAQILAHYYPGTTLSPAPTGATPQSPTRQAGRTLPQAKNRPHSNPLGKGASPLNIRVQEPTL